MKNNHKYIFIIGGVMSGVGKGVTTSSIGKILQSKGFNISLVKADPYLNVDAGTMNPTEHGEVFVMDSGLETDQDMGNYERFLNKSMPEENYLTNGMIFKYVIDKERALGFKGKCVEPVYHITEEILNRIKNSIKKTNADITIFEIGGTVGEYQNAIFLEAARILKLKNPKDVMFIMVSYLPVPGKIGEMKTKPTQNAIRQLNSYGINADMIIARSEVPIDNKRKEKIAFSTGISVENVISAPDIESIYDVPINFEKDGLSNTILDHFNLKQKKNDMVKWRDFVNKSKNTKKQINIAMVGKYFNTGDFILSDVYVSVIEALKFSSYKSGVKPKLTWIDSNSLEKDSKKLKELKKFDGIIVPGGFGSNGVLGIISAIKFARENKIPYFGLCFGMQLAIIEYARNILNIKDATSREIDPNSENLFIDIMPEQKELVKENKMGGTMRLGAFPAKIKPNTIAREAYGKSEILERHRHRFEVSPSYIDQITAGGMVFSGVSPDGRLMEIVELPKSKHPFFLATQFHPEFLARPLSPHPLFDAFIKACIKNKK